jgi:hypothetical protein
MYKSKKHIRKTNRNKNRRTRKHKHTHSLGKKCAICSRGMRGGNCSSCINHLQSGGNNFYKPAEPIPGPFVGQSWGTSVRDWPGVNGIGGDRNYLAYNNYPTDPQTAMKLRGGRRKNKNTKRRGRGRRGGNSLTALIPQDLVNLGRDISFNTGSAYNALNGYKAPVNPLPYKDQLVSSNVSNLRALMKTI